MKKIAAILFCCLCHGLLFGQQSSTDRQVFLHYLEQLSKPVLTNLAGEQLKANMVVDLSPRIDNAAERKTYAYLEAFGRLLSGIGPWLQLEGGDAAEVKLRN